MSGNEYDVSGVAANLAWDKVRRLHSSVLLPENGATQGIGAVDQFLNDENRANTLQLSPAGLEPTTYGLKDILSAQSAPCNARWKDRVFQRQSALSIR
jgi:hypothetical protein